MKARIGMVVLMAAVMIFPAFTGCFGQEKTKDQPLEEIRLNHLRMKGTHNSYHLKTPGVWALNAEYNFTHSDLDVQADRLGVRQFEIDVHYSSKNGLEVYHTMWDYASSCALFTSCMQLLLNWSTEHPEHAPIWIFVEPKDEPSMVEEIDILEMIQTDINATWPRERTITPSDVQGDALTLRDAIVNQGWPTLEESRGKVLFVLLDKTEIRDLYVERNPTLENQSMFAIVDEAESLASIVSLIDPIDQQERLSEASATGFMVRTRPDAATVEAQAGDYTRFASALTSGANFITTDFPGNDREIQYAIWLPEGPVMCHPERAPPHCTTGMIEPWGNYTPISTG
jgi:hypothetical protein